MATDKLTKRQQKAAAFRKGKRKAQDEPRDLPEGIEQDDDEQPAVEQGGGEEATERVEGAAAKRRRRKKAAQVRDGEKRGSRLIVFVGNLPFTATSQAVTDFFGEHCGPSPS